MSSWGMSSSGMSNWDSQTPRVELVCWRHPDGDPRTRFESETKDNLIRIACRQLTGSAGSVTRNQWGKPIVEGAQVSLTHCGPWIAAVAAQDRIGIDIEVERERAFGRLARRLQWDNTPERWDAQTFYLRWTLWEAALKAQRREARRLVAAFPDVLQPASGLLEARGEIEGWWAATGKLAEDLRIAVIGAGGPAAIRLTVLEDPPVG